MIVKNVFVWLVVTIFTSFFAHAQTVEWKWTVSGGGTGWDHGYALTTDRQNAVIVRGKFLDSGYFGDTVIIADAPESDYLAKYDSSGRCRWALKLDTKADWERDRSLAADGNNHIYITGYFEQTVTLGGHTIISRGGRDVFIACMDAEGKVLWAKSIGGKLADEGYSAAVDEDNNIYIGGYFQDTAYFDSLQFISAGGKDIFIAKFDPAGRLQWLKKAGGPGNDFTNSLAADKNGHLLAFGSFNGLALFDTLQLDAGPGTDMFIARFSTSGKLLHLIKEGGNGNIESKSIGWGNGMVCITGKFGGSVTFNKSVSLTAGGQSDSYVAMYDSQLVFVKVLKATCSTPDEGNSIAVSDTGIIVAGAFTQAFSIGGKTANCQGMRDAFLVCLDFDGNARWLRTAQMSSGTAMALANSVVLASGGNVYACGEYMGIGSFGGFNPISRGSFDMFLCRFTDTVLNTGIKENVENNRLVLYPTLASSSVFISVAPGNDAGCKPEIYNINGVKIPVDIISAHEGMIEIRTSDLSPGMYIVVYTDGCVRYGRFIKL